MEMMDSKQLKQQTAQCLAAATYPPQKLALIHAGVALGCSLLLTVISYLLSGQVSNTGGLAGIGTRAVLQSVQSILSMGLTVAMPFWEFGFVAAAMRYGRQERVEFRDLCKGFRSIPSLLRLLLLQAIVYMLILVAVIQVASMAILVTPLGNGMMDLMQTLSENESFLQTGAFPEEMLEPLIRAAMPAYVAGGILFAVLAIPLSYRLRLAVYMVLDGENRALPAMLTSNRIMKGNCLDYFKLDLSFWWYWALQALCSLLAFGDVLLPLAGVELPWDARTAMLLFYGAQMVGSLLLAWAWRAPVETAYAMAYDILTQE